MSYSLWWGPWLVIFCCVQVGVQLWWLHPRSSVDDADRGAGVDAIVPQGAHGHLPSHCPPPAETSSPAGPDPSTAFFLPPDATLSFLQQRLQLATNLMKRVHARNKFRERLAAEPVASDLTREYLTVEHCRGSSLRVATVNMQGVAEHWETRRGILIESLKVLHPSH
jgi:hypothetical protein